MALPSWLTFDSYSNILYGTAAVSDIGSITLELKAYDTYLESSTILNVNLEVKLNNAPQIRVGKTMPAQYIKSMMDFSF